MSTAGEELRNLNRISCRTGDGYEWEADQRHADILAQELGLTEESKPLCVPGRKRTQLDLEADETAREPAATTAYRALAARANSLAIDRPDISYAVKALRRRMLQPDAGDQQALKRLARFLLERLAWCSGPIGRRPSTESKWIPTAIGAGARARGNPPLVVSCVGEAM